jgi:hypothetical protein
MKKEYPRSTGKLPVALSLTLVKSKTKVSPRL